MGYTKFGRYNKSIEIASGLGGSMIPPARAETLEGDVWSIEIASGLGVSMIPPAIAWPLWGLKIPPKLRPWRETSGEH